MTEPGHPLVRIRRGLSKPFGDTVALDDLTLDRPGEFVTSSAPRAAGKSPRRSSIYPRRRSSDADRGAG